MVKMVWEKKKNERKNMFPCSTTKRKCTKTLAYSRRIVKYRWLDRKKGKPIIFRRKKKYTNVIAVLNTVRKFSYKILF